MKKPIRQHIREHVWGPAGSVILHLVLLLVLLNFIKITPPEESTAQSIDIVHIPDKVLNPIDKVQDPIDPTDSIKGIPDRLIQIEPPEVEEPDPVPDPVSVSENSVLVFNTLPAIKMKLPGPYEPRGPGNHRDIIRRHDGPDGVEASVVRALEWLKQNQEPDGSWKEYRTAMTSLALLTFLAHGETVTSERYGTTVEKATRFLINHLDEDGRFSHADPHYAYTHGIATYALAEAYGMMRIPMLRPYVERAVQAIIDGQQRGGAWDYNWAKDARRDTSVSAWQAQALKAAFLADVANPGLVEAIDRCIRDIKSVYSKDQGKFLYGGPGGGTFATTGGGILCLQLLGQGDSREVKGGVGFLRTKGCDWDDPDTQHALYSWYYMTQALFHHGGAAWQTWNRKFARTLITAQNKDGHWDIPGGNKKQHAYGPVFNTTLAALTLQVYYRQLPTTTEEAVRIEKKPEDIKDKDDVRVRLVS